MRGLFPDCLVSSSIENQIRLFSWIVCLPNLCLLVIYSIAYIEFKSEADAEKMLEEAQGLDVQGRSIIVDFVGEKSQKGGKGAGKFCTVSMAVCKINHQLAVKSRQLHFLIQSASLSPQRSGRPIKPWW